MQSQTVFIHILGGTLALLFGAAAFSFAKGSRLHAKAGTAFVVSMLVLALTGTAIAILKPAPLSAVNGILTCYLVATAWMATRRRPGPATPYEILALLVAASCAIVDIVFGLRAAGEPRGMLYGFPWQAYFVFAAFAALAAGLDLNFILRRGLTSAKRMARHLWRMSAALFVATGSFFLGQQQVLPTSVQGSPILVGMAIAPLVLMIFWLVRIRFANVAPNAFGGAGEAADKRRRSE